MADNFCKLEMMAECSAEKKEQKKCKFYRQASHDKRCMYFVMDFHCDNPEAQEEAKK